MYIEIESIKLGFCTYKPRPVDSVFIHRNWVHWTQFLFGPPCVLQIALKKLSKQHSQSLSFPPTLSLSQSLTSLCLSISLRHHPCISFIPSCPFAPSSSPFLSIAVPRMAFWQWFLSQQPQGIILIWSLLCGFWVFISLYEWLFGLSLCFREMGCWCWFCLFTISFVLFFFLNFFFGCNVNWVECLNWRLIGFWIFF